MLIFAILCAHTALAVVFKQAGPTGWQNHWDDQLQYSAGCEWKYSHVCGGSIISDHDLTREQCLQKCHSLSSCNCVTWMSYQSKKCRLETGTSTKGSSSLSAFDVTADYEKCAQGRTKIITGIKSIHDNNRQDRLHSFFVGSADGVRCTPGHWTDWRNSYNGHLNFECPRNQALYSVWSEHSNKREDRIWRFKCCDLSNHGKHAITSIHRSEWMNDWNWNFEMKCPETSVMVGIVSTHHNTFEDRRQAIKCGIVEETANPTYMLPKQLEKRTSKTDHQGRYWRIETEPDRQIKLRSHTLYIEVKGGQLRLEDRRSEEDESTRMAVFGDVAVDAKAFTFVKMDGADYGKIRAHSGACVARVGDDEIVVKSCKEEDPDFQWEYDPLSGLIKNRSKCMQTSRIQRNVFLRDCNASIREQQWDFGFGGHKVLRGLQVEFSRSKRDNRFQLIYSTAPGMTCTGGSWTAAQNEWHGILEFRCGHDQALMGIRTWWDGSKKDRKYSFRCCDFSGTGFVIQPNNIRHTGGLMGHAEGSDIITSKDVTCAENEVLVGLNARKPNGASHRQLSLVCGILEQTPPDYDDCQEIEIVEMRVGKVSMVGPGELITVSSKSKDWDFCGSTLEEEESVVSITDTIEEEEQQTLTWADSFDKHFDFSQEIGTNVKLSSKVTTSAGVEGVASGSVEAGFEIGFSSKYTAAQGFAVKSTDTESHVESKKQISSTTFSGTYKAEPWQHRKLTASFMKKAIQIPLQFRTRCLRKDGKYKSKWVDAALHRAEYSALTVKFEDLTHECPQSYYHKCECVDGLVSDGLTKEGCQTHPFRTGHPGCYVYKGNNCGNGHGLGVREPLSNTALCLDKVECPDHVHYVDYPVDHFAFEWSYMPCGGEQYYPGDPGWKGPYVDDLITRVPNKHCNVGMGGTLGNRSYKNKLQAVLACIEKNNETPNTCYGVYDQGCDHKDEFYLCDQTEFKESDTSCVWAMQVRTPIDLNPTEEDEDEDSGNPDVPSENAENLDVPSEDSECVDVKPPKRWKNNTCNKQLENTANCEKRRSGELTDGYCLKTCGACPVPAPECDLGGVEGQRWAWVNEDEQSFGPLKLLSDAQVKEVQAILRAGGDVSVDTDMKLRIQRDDSKSASRVKFIRKEGGTGDVETMLFNVGNSDHTHIELLNGGRQIKCTGNSHGHHRCNSLPHGVALDIILVEVYLAPRSGTAYNNLWWRNKYTLTGTKYNVVKTSCVRDGEVKAGRRLESGLARRLEGSQDEDSEEDYIVTHPFKIQEGTIVPEKTTIELMKEFGSDMLN